MKQANLLINESSPYLLQHAYNPVKWYPWSNEALKIAKTEDKLLIISIGYAACHWCHVMENESFENKEIAKYMNENFICIKVDREERPDIDQVYMSAVQTISGGGGWPLNCFALPDGRPVYGGTYFKPSDWMYLLKNLSEGYRNKRDKYLKAAENIRTNVLAMDFIEQNNDSKDIRFLDIEKHYHRWKRDFDNEQGGNKGNPKFPMPNSLQFLLKYHFYTKDETALEHVILTLNNMALGGIYDHIGGGFARYSVDAYWKVPHFEKMLYDNAQLVSLYSDAYLYTKKDLYKNVVYETLNFVKREMTASSGGFYSSLDADSEGEEGKFYTWKADEIKEILNDEATEFCFYYNILEEGNWENGLNILFNDNINHLTNEIPAKLYTFKKKLLEARNKRTRPALDDKIITSWNALMIKAYLDAYRVFGEPEFLQNAYLNADFILENLYKDERLFHVYSKGEAKINAFLDDYSFIIEAFISLYQQSFEDKWLTTANELIQYVIKHFYNKNNGMFFYTSDIDDKLIVRKTDYADNVIPASNSSLANALFMLGTIIKNDDYINYSKQIILNISKEITRPEYFSNTLSLMLYYACSPFEVSYNVKHPKELMNDINKYYNPDCISYKDINKEKGIKDKEQIFVCRAKTCFPPVTNIFELNDLLTDKRFHK